MSAENSKIKKAIPSRKTWILELCLGARLCPLQQLHRHFGDSVRAFRRFAVITYQRLPVSSRSSTPSIAMPSPSKRPPRPFPTSSQLGATPIPYVHFHQLPPSTRLGGLLTRSLGISAINRLVIGAPSHAPPQRRAPLRCPYAAPIAINPITSALARNSR